MRKLYLAMGMALVAMFVAAGTVYAAVTFDPETGEGFVGKGDVQLAFNWNNKQLQQNATGVSFTYEETASYTFVCSRIHPQQGYQEQTFRNKVQSIEASLDGDPRQVKGQKQFTGYILGGIDSTVVTGEGCPPAFPNEVSKTPNEGAGTDVGLFAHFDINKDGDYDDAGETVLIWTPPAPAPEPTV